MAATKSKKKTAAVDLPDCPVCVKSMTAPIFLCLSGHSLCSACTQALRPPTCPICNQAMTQMRNRSLEELINKAKVPCPHRAAGCPFSPESAGLNEHVRECIFRSMECPLATALGKCSWTGQLKQIMEHVKEKHPNACDVGLDADVELEGITLRECDRRMFLTAQYKLLFIITVKIDTIQRMAYWTVQLIGPKKFAYQHIYEIHVTSKRDAQRKVIFTEHCSSDAVKADDIFRQSACAVLPLDLLAHFIKQDKLSFRYYIRKITNANPNPKGGTGEVTNDNFRAPRGVSSSRGSGNTPAQTAPGKNIDAGA